MDSRDRGSPLPVPVCGIHSRSAAGDAAALPRARLTRLTNAFSKEVENLQHALALHFMYYNFARMHQTVKMTPAMAAGVADHVWSIGEIVALLPN